MRQMFFLWFDKNKHFKKASGIKAQVTPFLIIALVILLTAAFVTINIGRVALDKTETGNTADAGSLAAATAWALSLDYLAQANEGLNNTSAYYFAAEDAIYTVLDEDLDEAILWYYAALALAGLIVAANVAALIWLSQQDPMRCATANAIVGAWMAAMAILSSCARLCLLSAQPILLNIKTKLELLQDTIQQHYIDTHALLCAMIEAMDAVPSDAKSAALSLAFANSGISGKLGESQQDAFGAWLKAEGYNSGYYDWKDKLDQKHSVSVDANVSGIDSYGVEYPTYTLDQANTLLDSSIALITDVINFVETMMERFTAATEDFGYAALGFAAAVLTCTCCYTCVWPPLVIAACAIYIAGVLWGVTWWAVAMYQIGENMVQLIKNLGDLGSIQDWVDEIREKLSLAEVIQGEISACSGADGLFVIRITEVNMNYCGVSTTAQATNPGPTNALWQSSYPTITSRSTACFDGGNVGEFQVGYSPRLSSTD